ACEKRIWDELATPGTCATALPAALGIEDQPSLFSTTRPALTLVSIALLTDFLMPAAKIVTPETRARPTISAAAVEAVRAVLRVAFSRASWPLTPRRVSIGRPTNDAIGRTKR